MGVAVVRILRMRVVVHDGPVAMRMGVGADGHRVVDVVVVAVVVAVQVLVLTQPPRTASLARALPARTR